MAACCLMSRFSQSLSSSPSPPSTPLLLLLLLFLLPILCRFHLSSTRPLFLLPSGSLFHTVWQRGRREGKGDLKLPKVWDLMWWAAWVSKSISKMRRSQPIIKLKTGIMKIRTVNTFYEPNWIRLQMSCCCIIDSKLTKNQSVDSSVSYRKILNNEICPSLIYGWCIVA